MRSHAKNAEKNFISFEIETKRQHRQTVLYLYLIT